MAGSYRHCIRVLPGGGIEFRGAAVLIERMGEAVEALEEMFDMIEFLSGGDKQRILDAHNHHCMKRYGGIHSSQTVEEYFER